MREHTVLRCRIELEVIECDPTRLNLLKKKRFSVLVHIWRDFLTHRSLHSSCMSEAAHHADFLQRMSQPHIVQSTNSVDALLPATNTWNFPSNVGGIPALSSGIPSRSTTPRSTDMDFITQSSSQPSTGSDSLLNRTNRTPSHSIPAQSHTASDSFYAARPGTEAMHRETAWDDTAIASIPPPFVPLRRRQNSMERSGNDNSSEHMQHIPGHHLCAFAVER